MSKLKIHQSEFCKEAINLPHMYGDTYLHTAAENGDLKMVKKLLEHGADPNIKNKLEQTPLWIVHSKNGPKIIKLLIDAGADIHIRSSDKQTALHQQSSWRNHHKNVACLLKYGAQINAKTCSGDAAVHEAILYKNCKTLKILIDAGANIYETSYEGIRNLLLAAHVSNADETELVDILMAAGASFRGIRDSYGMTPLIYASSNGNIPLIKIFLREGANVNETDVDLSSPLHYAAKYSDYEVCKLLIDNGAYVNVSCTLKTTPLHYATKNGKDDVAELLLENGANVNAKDQYYDTPLHHSAEHGNVESLILHGADVNARNILAQTPLYVAASRCKVKNVKLLLEAGADPEIKDNKGVSAKFYLDNIGITE